MKASKAVKHTVEKILSAEIEKDIPGYPYFGVEEFFPEEYYQELLENSKSIDMKNFRPLSANYKNRYIYDLNCGENSNEARNSFESLSDKETAFWAEFQTVFLVSGAIKEAFLQKYGEYIDFPFAHAIQPQCRIQRDFKGYKIGPHRDNLDKIMSVMIYTSDHHDEETMHDHGTALCVPKFGDALKVPLKEGHVGTGDSRHFNFDEVDIIKTAPAKPNSMFSWAVADRSYHGVTPLKSDKTRHTMAYFMKIPKHLSRHHKLYGWANFKKTGENL